MSTRTSPGLLIAALVAVAVVGVPAATDAVAADVNTDYQQVVDITFPLTRDTPVRYQNDYYHPRSSNRHHQATDLMVAPRTPVYAALGGTVGWMSTDPARSGWMFNVHGDDGRTYVYIHLGFDDESRDTAYAPFIERGVRVERGELIGWAGCSGSATCGGGEHLHFEIHDNNVIDPYDHHNHERINPYFSLIAAEERGDYPTGEPVVVEEPVPAPHDVPLASPHRASVEDLFAAGITTGCNPPDNDRYCPADLVTRAQMATFLKRTADSWKDARFTTQEVNEFTDTEDSVVHRDSILWLASTGVTRGCNPPDNDRYCPTDAVTRAQMASFLVRAFGLEDTSDRTFADVDPDGGFAADIDKLATAGITYGCNPPDNDRYCPADPVTRAQMASFLMRALDHVNG